MMFLYDLCVCVCTICPSHKQNFSFLVVVVVVVVVHIITSVHQQHRQSSESQSSQSIYPSIYRIKKKKKFLNVIEWRFVYTIIVCMCVCVYVWVIQTIKSNLSNKSMKFFCFLSAVVIVNEMWNLNWNE